MRVVNLYFKVITCQSPWTQATQWANHNSKQKHVTGAKNRNISCAFIVHY